QQRLPERCLFPRSLHPTLCGRTERPNPADRSDDQYLISGCTDVVKVGVEVMAIHVHNGCLRSVQTDSGLISTPLAVNCSGARATASLLLLMNHLLHEGR